MTWGESRARGRGGPASGQEPGWAQRRPAGLCPEPANSLQWRPARPVRVAALRPPGRSGMDQRPAERPPPVRRAEVGARVWVCFEFLLEDEALHRVSSSNREDGLGKRKEFGDGSNWGLRTRKVTGSGWVPSEGAAQQGHRVWGSPGAQRRCLAGGRLVSRGLSSCGEPGCGRPLSAGLWREEGEAVPGESTKKGCLGELHTPLLPRSAEEMREEAGAPAQDPGDGGPAGGAGAGEGCPQRGLWDLVLNFSEALGGGGLSAARRSSQARGRAATAVTVPGL